MIRAKTIMTENVVTVKETASLNEAAKLMLNRHVSTLMVTRDSKPVAILTENSIIKGFAGKKAGKVKDVMSKNFFIINPDTSYAFIIKKLREEKIKLFPVIENGKLFGIITETDIVDATRDLTRFHQVMQEVILTVFGLVTAFFLFFFSPLGQSLRRSLA
ncbi:CBS domain-containing protein [Candidatus Woesearchaeota archaeon]|nr:CBS domain-containing protein [Candidatus Woesearchaeota archaeon]